MTRSIHSVSREWLLGWLNCYYARTKRDKDYFLTELDKDTLHLLYTVIIENE
jgi:hypothetical protein